MPALAASRRATQINWKMVISKDVAPSSCTRNSRASASASTKRAFSSRAAPMSMSPFSCTVEVASFRSRVTGKACSCSAISGSNILQVPATLGEHAVPRARGPTSVWVQRRSLLHFIEEEMWIAFPHRDWVIYRERKRKGEAAAPPLPAPVSVTTSPSVILSAAPALGCGAAYRRGWLRCTRTRLRSWRPASHRPSARGRKRRHWSGGSGCHTRGHPAGSRCR
jgi:hypothetical protein